MWPSELESLKRRQERAALQRLAEYLPIAVSLRARHGMEITSDTMRLVFGLANRT